MSDVATETYVVHAKTDRSTVSVGTQDPSDALKRAREMAGPGVVVTITDREGSKHTIEEMEANILSGTYALPGSSAR